MALFYSAALPMVPTPVNTGSDEAFSCPFSPRADPVAAMADSTSDKPAAPRSASTNTGPAVPLSESTSDNSVRTLTEAVPAEMTDHTGSVPVVHMADSTSAKPSVLIPAVGCTNPSFAMVDFPSVCPAVPRPALARSDSDGAMVDSTSTEKKALSKSARVKRGRALSLQCPPVVANVETMSADPRFIDSQPGNHKKPDSKKSKYINSQPLYQEYWSQCTGMDPRPGGASFRVDTSLSMAGIISTSLLSPPQMSPRDYAFSFWQDIPQVKSSGLLDRLSPQERQLQEAVFEVVTSEASYLRSLSVAVNHFQRSSKLAESLSVNEAHTLFSNLQQVKDVSERFLLDLEEQLEWDVFLANIGDVVLKHTPAFHKVYVPYVTNQMYQERLMQQLMQANMKFIHFLQTLEYQSVCRRQSLKSFLVLPFQRITRLKILLETILKRSLGGAVMALSVGRALTAVSQIVWECNENIGRMKQTEELVLLEKQVHFLKTKSIPLISRGRWLLRQGTLSEILFQESGPGQRPGLSARPIYLHLFCDLLLVSRSENGYFYVEDYACPSHVKAEHFKAKALGLPPMAFLLCLLRNHAGINFSFVLEAANENEKQEWVTLLSSQMRCQAPPNGGGECPGRCGRGPPFRWRPGIGP